MITSIKLKDDLLHELDDGLRLHMHDYVTYYASKGQNIESCSSKEQEK